MHACSACDVISCQAAFGGRGGILKPGTGAMNLPSSLLASGRLSSPDTMVTYLLAPKKWRGGGRRKQQYLIAACHWAALPSCLASSRGSAGRLPVAAARRGHGRDRRPQGRAEAAP